MLDCCNLLCLSFFPPILLPSLLVFCSCSLSFVRFCDVFRCQCLYFLGVCYFRCFLLLASSPLFFFSHRACVLSCSFPLVLVFCVRALWSSYSRLAGLSVIPCVSSPLLSRFLFCPFPLFSSPSFSRLEHTK